MIGSRLAAQQQMDERSMDIITAVPDSQDIFESFSEKHTRAMFSLHHGTRSKIAHEHAVTQSVIVEAIKEANALLRKRTRTLSE